MTMEAIGRVPVTDWLMGLVVLASGVAAIVTVWRYCDRLGGSSMVADEEPDEGGGRSDDKSPLALPPGPGNGVTVPDEIDEELWSIIDTERRRLSERAEPQRADRIAAKAAQRPTAATQSPGPAHAGQRHRRAREDRRPPTRTTFPTVDARGNAHPSPSKRRSWGSRTGR